MPLSLEEAARERQARLRSRQPQVEVESGKVVEPEKSSLKTLEEQIQEILSRHEKTFSVKPSSLLEDTNEDDDAASVATASEQPAITIDQIAPRDTCDDLKRLLRADTELLQRRTERAVREMAKSKE